MRSTGNSYNSYLYLLCLFENKSVSDWSPGLKSMLLKVILFLHAPAVVVGGHFMKGE